MVPCWVAGGGKQADARECEERLGVKSQHGLRNRAS